MSESEKKKRKESFRAVLLAFLQSRNLTQRKLAIEIDMKAANVNQRIKAGSMRPDMIMKINQRFGVDFLEMVSRYEAGEDLRDVMIPPEKKDEKVVVQIDLTPEEMKQVMLNQQKSQEELQDQFNQLVSQIKTWIQHDQEKMRKQEEIINMLMEERAELKSKTKK